MNLEENVMSVSTSTKVFRSNKVIRFAVGISLALALAGPAFAQYGGGGRVAKAVLISAITPVMIKCIRQAKPH